MLHVGVRWTVRAFSSLSSRQQSGQYLRAERVTNDPLLPGWRWHLLQHRVTCCRLRPQSGHKPRADSFAKELLPPGRRWHALHLGAAALTIETTDQKTRCLVLSLAQHSTLQHAQITRRKSNQRDMSVYCRTKAHQTMLELAFSFVKHAVVHVTHRPCHAPSLLACCRSGTETTSESWFCLPPQRSFICHTI